MLVDPCLNEYVFGWCVSMHVTIILRLRLQYPIPVINLYFLYIQSTLLFANEQYLNCKYILTAQRLGETNNYQTVPDMEYITWFI